MDKAPISVSTAVSESSYECTIAAECCVFGFQENILKILLVKRSIEPFKDYWMLPGGVMSEGETLTEAVDKVLFSLTGIGDIPHEQVACYGDIQRHPVKRVVSVLFYALVRPENHPAVAKNYISEVAWYPLSELPKLGFDHEALYSDALIKLREKLKQYTVFGELLPEYFTLTELQELFENILGENLDRRNFRKKILQMDMLTQTSKKKPGVKGGPTLFRLKNPRK